MQACHLYLKHHTHYTPDFGVQNMVYHYDKQLISIKWWRSTEHDFLTVQYVLCLQAAVDLSILDSGAMGSCSCWRKIFFQLHDLIPSVLVAKLCYVLLSCRHQALTYNFQILSILLNTVFVITIKLAKHGRFVLRVCSCIHQWRIKQSTIAVVTQNPTPPCNLHIFFALLHSIFLFFHHFLSIQTPQSVVSLHNKDKLSNFFWISIWCLKFLIFFKWEKDYSVQMNSTPSQGSVKQLGPGTSPHYAPLLASVHIVIAMCFASLMTHFKRRSVFS